MIRHSSSRIGASSTSCAGVPAQLDERERRPCGSPDRRRARRGRAASPSRCRRARRRSRRHRRASASDSRRAPGARRRRRSSVDRVGELAAVAEQRRRSLRPPSARSGSSLRARLEQRLRACPSSWSFASSAARTSTRARAFGSTIARPERSSTSSASSSGTPTRIVEPRERLEHVGAIGLEPIGFAIRVERAARRRRARARRSARSRGAARRARLSSVDVDRAAAEQIDQHRPLAGRAIEQLERLVRLRRGRARSSSTRSKQSAAW